MVSDYLNTDLKRIINKNQGISNHLMKQKVDNHLFLFIYRVIMRAK